MQLFATFCRSLTFFITVLSLLCSEALAVPLIRDAEIEHTLREFTDPIFKVNGLKPSAVNLFIVQDDSLNSYVAGGANIFIHTGLMLDCTTPDMLIGVLAHETGHIVGGHLAQGSEKLKDAQLGSILSFVLGAAAAAASRNPGAAAAVITGGQGAVGRNFMAFTRAHEEAADQVALSTLDRLNISAEGLLKVFELLRRHERQHPGTPDPYMLTHPLTSIRMEHVRDHVDHSTIPEGQYPPAYTLPYQRVVAKLAGFLESPEHTLQKYPIGNKSVPARMARAIAYYKMPDLARALSEMEGLINESPKDPFFHELKGQILFENNHPKEALSSYQTAVALLPSSPLILADLAKVELAQNDPSLVPSAVAHLQKSTALDGSNASSWRQLSTAYSKMGNTGMAALSLAEEAVLDDDPKQALAQINVALPLLKEGTPSRQQAQDIKEQALDMRREKKDAQSPF